MGPSTDNASHLRPHSYAASWSLPFRTCRVLRPLRSLSALVRSQDLVGGHHALRPLQRRIIGKWRTVDAEDLASGLSRMGPQAYARTLEGATEELRRPPP